jgi:enterochelin esterase-like enzyme
MNTSRTQVWLESLGEWSWPGRSAAAVEALPPSWVPAFPPRAELAGAGSAGIAAPGSWQSERTLAPWLGTGALLSALAVLCAALVLNGPLSVERALGIRAAARPVATLTAQEAAASSPQALPTLVELSQDSAGSSVDTASYASAALNGRGSFLAYLPPGYGSTTRHYPVLYLLHGNNQQASAFLQIGLQGELDRLIAHHVIPPMIAVMIQGGRGPNNWRNYGGRNYEAYVLEVQELVDRTLPTVADRAGRAIAGDSMGGYGAMNLTLAHPDRFAAVESWLGFFNGLEGQLRDDRAVISRNGLHAFLYGGTEDKIADPSENAPFAAALRAAGANAHGVVYSGGHSLETIEAHLESMLTFAGRALLPRSIASPERSPKTIVPG